ncbi:MAG: sulfotransferase family protein [Chloroflexota bacterium]
MEPLRERPFFILGQPRSGTTLLRAIANSHPRLYVPPETGFLPFLRIGGRAPAGDEPLTQDQAAALLEQISRLNQEWDGLVRDPAAFYYGLCAGREAPTVTAVLDALYRRMMGDQGERWGDKTPSYVRYITAIDRLFPAAQFVHVIRDARDTVLSARDKWEDQRHLDSYYLLRHWVESVSAGRREGARLGPARYLEVRYEDLVARPAETVREVCDFLGETFHPAMLDHTRQFQEEIAAGGKRRGGHPEVRNPIFTSSAGRWRREMGPFDRKLARYLAGPVLRALAYETPETGPWSAGERVRLALLALRYHLLAGARRLLYATGVLTLNRGKRSKTSIARRERSQTP